MYRKNCFTCNRPSYSSNDQGEWVCPICGADLTKGQSLPAEPVVIRKEQFVQYELFKFRELYSDQE